MSDPDGCTAGTAGIVTYCITATVIAVIAALAGRRQ